MNATIELFAAPELQRARYIVSLGFFKKGEIADLCVRHLGVPAKKLRGQPSERSDEVLVARVKTVDVLDVVRGRNGLLSTLGLDCEVLDPG